MRALFLCLAFAHCTDTPHESVAPQRVQAIAKAQAASLGTEVAASKPVATHPGQPARKLCDRSYASKEGAKTGTPGKASWVNLWAAWCKPCVAEIPMLRVWAQKGGYDIIFVSLDDDVREWRTGVDKLGLPKGQNGKDGHVVSRWAGPGKARADMLRAIGIWDTPSLPAQALNDRDGHLRCFRSGAVESDEAEAFAALMSGL